MMSSFIKEFAKKKLKQLNHKDLLRYSAEYGFSLTENQAYNIIDYIKTNDFDPFEANERLKMLEDLAQITDEATAIKADRLFNELITSYGLDHLFN